LYVDDGLSHVTFPSIKSQPSMKNERDALKYKEEGVQWFTYFF